MSSIENESKDIMKSTEKDSVKKRCCGIYGLRNKITGKWYVGQSLVNIYDRWDSYRKLKCKKQWKLHRAISKYGYSNFEEHVLDICDEVQWILDYREVYWIKYLDSITNGYNIREGGSSGKLAESTKEKLRQLMRGRVPGEEEARRQKEGCKNRPKWSAEARQRQRDIMIARGSPTEETKEKMRKAMEGRTRPDSYIKRIMYKLSGVSYKNLSDIEKVEWRTKANQYINDNKKLPREPHKRLTYNEIKQKSKEYYYTHKQERLEYQRKRRAAQKLSPML